MEKIKKFIKKYRWSIFVAGFLVASVIVLFGSYYASIILVVNEPAVDTPRPIPTIRSLPTVTPKPTQTPVPTPTAQPADCTWSATYVADVTIPDGTVVRSGSTFTKTWRIQNTGTCAWNKAILVFTAGDNLSGERTLIPDALPGEEVEVSVLMVAPLAPGDYIGTWMTRKSEHYFGAVTVVITSQ